MRLVFYRAFPAVFLFWARFSHRFHTISHKARSEEENGRRGSMRGRRPKRHFFFYVQRRSNAALVWLLAVCCLLALGALVVDLRLRPQIQEWSQARARYLASRVINEAISQEMEENREEYRELVRFEKDQFGQILAVQTDIVTINHMKARIVSRISEKLNDTDISVLRIPIGNALGGDFFYGRGPLASVRIIPLGSANADFISVFTNAGINQTRHQVIIEAAVELSVLVPGSESVVTVSSQISVAETVLIGNVPESYAYISGQGAGKYYPFDGLAENQSSEGS